MLKGRVLSSSIPVRLVVNADGLGASAARNCGILAAYRQGIVTSTAVLGNAADPGAVKAELDKEPGLGVGVLLTLVGGPAVAHPSAVSSLLDPSGSFPADTRSFLLNWAKAAIRPVEVEVELDAQVGRLRDLGLKIDHLCTAHDLACLPMIAVALEAVARRHGIAGIRTAVEKPALTWVSDPRRGLATAALGAMAWYSRRHLGARRHGPQTWGHFESGRLDEVRVLEILGRLGPGSHEIVCHPDLDPSLGRFPVRSEIEALTSTRVQQALEQRNIELCRWQDLL